MSLEQQTRQKEQELQEVNELKPMSYLEEQFLVSAELQELNEAIVEYLTAGELKPLLLAGLNLKAYLGRLSRSVVISGQGTKSRKRRYESDDDDEEGLESGLDFSRPESSGHKKRSESSTAKGKLEMKHGNVQVQLQVGKAPSTYKEGQELVPSLIQYSSSEDDESGGSVVKRHKIQYQPRKVKSILRVRQKCNTSDESDEEQARAYSGAAEQTRQSQDTTSTEREERRGQSVRYSNKGSSIAKTIGEILNKTVQLNEVDAVSMSELQLHNLVFTDVSTSKVDEDSYKLSSDIYTGQEVGSTNEGGMFGSERINISGHEVRITSRKSDQSNKKSPESNSTGSVDNKDAQPQKKFWMCIEHNEEKEFTLTLPKIVIASSTEREKQKHLVVSADIFPSDKKQACFCVEPFEIIEDKRSRFISPEDLKLLNRQQRYPPSSDSSDSSDSESDMEKSSSSDDDFTPEDGLTQEPVGTDDFAVSDDEEYHPFGEYDPALQNDEMPSVTVPHTSDDNSNIIPQKYVDMIGSELLALEHQRVMAVGSLKTQSSIITNCIKHNKKTLEGLLKNDTKLKKNALKHRYRRMTALYDFFKVDSNGAFSRELGKMTGKLKQSCARQQPALLKLTKPEIKRDHVAVLSYSTWVTPLTSKSVYVKEKLGRVEGDIKGFYTVSESGKFMSIDGGLVNSTKKFETLSVTSNGKLALMSTGKSDTVKISILTDHFMEYENLKVLSEVKTCKQFFCVFDHTTAFVTDDEVKFYLKNSKNVWNYELKTFRPENCMVISNFMYLAYQERILEINSETRDNMIYQSSPRNEQFSTEILVNFVRKGYKILTTEQYLHIFNPVNKKYYYYAMNSTFEGKLLISYAITATDIALCLRTIEDLRDFSIQKFPLDKSFY